VLVDHNYIPYSHFLLSVYYIRGSRKKKKKTPTEFTSPFSHAGYEKEDACVLALLRSAFMSANTKVCATPMALAFRYSSALARSHCSISINIERFPSEDQTLFSRRESRYKDYVSSMPFLSLDTVQKYEPPNESAVFIFSNLRIKSFCEDFIERAASIRSA